MTYQNLVSKGGNALRIIMLILTLSILNLAHSAGLEMRMYNVGQANFIALKHGTNALIVDCGAVSNKKWENMNSDLSEFLKETEHVSVFITHQHDDHYNKLNELFDLINLNQAISLEKVIIGGNVLHVDKNSKDQNKKIPHHKIDISNVSIKGKATFLKYGRNGIRSYNWENQNTEFNIQSEISNLLGEGVTTELLLPTIGNGTSESVINEDHFQNLVLKVSCGGRAILLPGDANGNLLSLLSKEDLENVDTVVFPHHGSIRNGEDQLFKWVQNCCLGIISSDPERGHHLPKSVENFSNFPISMGCYLKDKTQELKLKNYKEPIFITSNATLYYKLSISENGFMRMYDSRDLKTPVFLSDKKVNLSRWSEEVAKSVSAKCNWLEEVRVKTEKKYVGKKMKLFRDMVNTVEKSIIKAPSNNRLWQKFKNGIQGIIDKGNRLSMDALRIIITLLESNTQMQKSEFMDEVDGLSEYTWGKARDSLRDEGLMSYNSSTKKWAIVASSA